MPNTTPSHKQDRWMPAVIAGFLLVGAAMWASALLPRGEATPGEAPRDATATAAYETLGIWDGRLARFAPGQREPVQVYEVVIATLPEEAQQELANGIPLTSEELLLALLENYTS